MDLQLFFFWNGNMSSEKVHNKFCFHFDGRFPARCYHVYICMALRPFRFSWTRYTRKVWNVSHTVRWSIQVFRSVTWRRCGILTAINWKFFIKIRKRIDHSTQKKLCTQPPCNYPYVIFKSLPIIISKPAIWVAFLVPMLSSRLRSGSFEPLRRSWFCWCHYGTIFSPTNTKPWQSSADVRCSSCSFVVVLFFFARCFEIVSFLRSCWFWRKLVFYWGECSWNFQEIWNLRIILCKARGSFARERHFLLKDHRKTLDSHIT